MSGTSTRRIEKDLHLSQPDYRNRVMDTDNAGAVTLPSLLVMKAV
jgi:hypothetical protein